MTELPALSPDEVTANRAVWLTALESGNYPQACGLLRTDEGYCCLGVAEDARGAAWTGDGEDANGEYGVPDRFITLLDPVTSEPLRFPGTSRNVAFGSGAGPMLALLSADGMRWLGVLAADPFVVVWEDDGWTDATLTTLNDDWRLSLAQVAAVIRDQAPHWDGHSVTVNDEVQRRVAESVPRPAYARLADES